MPGSTPPRRVKKNRISFEEMHRIHEAWFANPVGTQEGVFNEHGWTRNAFFKEQHEREHGRDDAPATLVATPEA